MSCYQNHPLSYYGQNKGKIGSGAYSHVYEYKPKTSESQSVAVKMHNNQTAAFREMALLQECPAPNIVRLTDVGYDGRRRKFYQVMPLAKCTIYDQICEGTFEENPERLKEALFQIVQGLTHLHIHGYIHRDMKSENILFFEPKNPRDGGRYQLCDFGLSRRMNVPGESYTSYMVTLYYRPPENLLHQETYAQSMDIWSLGCIFAEMMVQDPPFCHEESDQVLKKQLERLGDPKGIYPDYLRASISKTRRAAFTQGKRWWIKHVKTQVCEEYGALAYDLLMHMLQLDPDKRITARKALMHPYFAMYAPIKVPILHLMSTYQPKEWRDIAGFTWSDRNRLFLECHNLVRGYGLPIHIVITCYCFLNKLFVQAPQLIAKDLSNVQLYVCVIINVVSKLSSWEVLHLRHFKEVGDPKILRKVRNLFLKAIHFQFNMRTGYDWFWEKRTQYRFQKAVHKDFPSRDWEKMYDQAQKLYHITFFIPSLLFRVPPEEVAEGCQEFILEHPLSQGESFTKPVHKILRTHLRNTVASLKKNEFFAEDVLVGLEEIKGLFP